MDPTAYAIISIRIHTTHAYTVQSTHTYVHVLKHRHNCVEWKNFKQDVSTGNV